ncbi:MAG: ATPase, T2SS/T4P/T4SS family, partial [Verrucomicrobia bacterium]|nr:ATPase, T2SS/T4P/T4SS family [Verrucomicrobiota bacterium]
MEALDSLCESCFKAGASDLFLREGAIPFVRVGEQLLTLETDVATQDLLSFLWTACGASAEATDHDASFVTRSGLRFRVNLYRQLGVRGAVLRNIKTQIPSMEELGLPVQLLQRWLTRPSGLILVTGSTGSGKSTTLAAGLEWLNQTTTRHIITIEDPVEYLFQDNLCRFTQREVGADTPSFAEGLRRALRQSPDIILLGEIRDAVSASTALQAAETGHLVLASVHSGSAAEAVERLHRIFSQEEREDASALLAAELVGVFTQQLIPGLTKNLFLVAEHFENQAATRQWIRNGGGTELVVFMQISQCP